MKPPGIGPQVLALVSSQGSMFGYNTLGPSLLFRSKMMCFAVLNTEATPRTWRIAPQMTWQWQALNESESSVLETETAGLSFPLGGLGARWFSG